MLAVVEVGLGADAVDVVVAVLARGGLTTESGTAVGRFGIAESQLAADDLGLQELFEKKLKWCLH